MLEALKAGYATMSTDNGHVTDMTQANGGSEQTWALGHPEKKVGPARIGPTVDLTPRNPALRKEPCTAFAFYEQTERLLR